MTIEMNISPSDITNKCDEKCLFTYNYTLVNSVNISNSGTCFIISYSSSNPPVTFNNLGYNLQNISIYFPSLHTFNSTQEIGEIVMNHTCQTNQTKILNICIPILSSGGLSCQLFNNIVACILGKSIYNTEDTTTITSSSASSYSLPNSNFNTFLNLTSSAPYYYYSQSKTQDVIVFGLNNGISLISALPVGETSNNITSLVTPETSILFPSVSNLYYNSDGPSVDYGDENIYIDCQPVNQSNEQILEFKSIKDMFSSSSPNKLGGLNSTLLEILVIFLIAIGISCGIYFGNKLRSQTLTKQVEKSWLNQFIEMFSDLWRTEK
jgi:hypothetical protein